MSRLPWSSFATRRPTWPVPPIKRINADSPFAEDSAVLCLPVLSGF
jgi:hypothetical protein